MMIIFLQMNRIFAGRKTLTREPSIQYVRDQTLHGYVTSVIRHIRDNSSDVVSVYTL